MSTPALIQPTHLQKLAIVYVRRSSVTLHPGDRPESAEAKRALAERARHWGWPDSRIEIIDSDHGVPASEPGRRQGFARMLDGMAAGKVALVLTTDVSRLFRHLRDAEDFLRVARARNVLFDVDGQLFSPVDRGGSLFTLLLFLHDWSESETRRAWEHWGISANDDTTAPLT